jgi:hypothetical protein
MKGKVTITRTECRQHDFDVEIPDGLSKEDACEAALKAANDASADYDWHDSPVYHADEEPEAVELED